MKKNQADYHHGDLRAALVAAARKTVEGEGADGLSLREVTRTLGVDIAATYRHFRKKEDVLAAVAAAGFDELGQLLASRLAAARKARRSARACFIACGTAYVDYGLAHPNLYRLMFGGRCSADAIQEARGTAPSNSSYDLLREALDMLADEGAMRPAAREGAELVAWAQVHGLVTLIIDGRGGMDNRDQVARQLDRHLDVLLRGFRSA
jgi:AcrR family transcriptional regulator